MEPNTQPPKLLIPKRGYNTPSQTIPAQGSIPQVIPLHINPLPYTSGRVQNPNFTPEETKQLPRSNFLVQAILNPNTNPPLQQTPPIPVQTSIEVQKKHPKIQQIQEKFENLRKTIKQKTDKTIEKLKNDYLKNVLEAKNQCEQQITDLTKLEELCLSQIIEAPKEPLKNPDIPEKVQEKPEITEKVQEKPEIAEIISPVLPKSFSELFLIGQSNQTVYISKDLNEINILNLPEEFTLGSNLMVLDGKNILIVYESGSVYTLNVFTNESKRLKDFNVKRSHFALCFIKAWPAIIGGIGKLSGDSLDVTEILTLENGSWSLGTPLKVPRSYCQAIKHQKCTYVFGGFSNGNLVSIEKYKKNWTLLSVRMPLEMTGFVLCSQLKKIYLFGGEGNDGGLKKVHEFSVETSKFGVAKDLPCEFENKNNACVRLIGGVFFLLDLKNSRVIKYQS